ncbi:hypothetical protein AZA_36365 [Nitrospirillum viridazoti Y2]|nr:hypothetical protein AZA_36365 [Nitrospirillum amazonense Y2]
MPVMPRSSARVGRSPASLAYDCARTNDSAVLKNRPVLISGDSTPLRFRENGTLT